MELEPITTAPKSGEFVILFDDKRGAYEVARWSTINSAWMREEDAAIRFVPSHWKPLADGDADKPPPQGSRECRRRRGVLVGTVLVFALTAPILAGATPQEIARRVETSARSLSAVLAEQTGSVARRLETGALPLIAKTSAALIEHTGRAARRVQTGADGPDAVELVVTATTVPLEPTGGAAEQEPSAQGLRQGDHLEPGDRLTRPAAVPDIEAVGAIPADQVQGSVPESRHIAARGDDSAREASSQISGSDASPISAPGSGGAADQAQRLAQERERVADLQRDLDRAKSQLDHLTAENTLLLQAKSAAETGSADQARALAQERETVAALQKHLQRAREEIEWLKQQGAADAAAARVAKRERERAAALRRELLATRREVQRLRESADGVQDVPQTNQLARNSRWRPATALGSDPSPEEQADAPSRIRTPTRRTDVRRRRPPQSLEQQTLIEN